MDTKMEMVSKIGDADKKKQNKENANSNMFQIYGRIGISISTITSNVCIHAHIV